LTRTIDTLPEILLAEDEEHIAKLVEFKLSRDGFHVVIAKDGQEAIDQLGARKWKLIILDIMMPIHDGWKVLQVLRSTYGEETPVIMLTAKGHQKDMSHAAELGATQFIRKPFDPAELSDQVKKLLKVETGKK
jgi:DNA-binding response OmpR family regulator